MTISLSSLNLLLFSFMIFASSMLQENTYFMKISFVTLILSMIIVSKNDIMKMIGKIKISKTFFVYLVIYVLFLYFLYFSIFINSAYNSFSVQVWKSTYLNILIIFVSYIFGKKLTLKYFRFLILFVLMGFCIESLYVFLTHIHSSRALGFGGILQLGQDTTFVLIISLSYIIYNRYYHFKYNFFIFLIVLLFFYGLYATGSRAPILGLFIAFIFIYFTLIRKNSILSIFKIFFYLFVTILVLYLLNSQFERQVNSIFNPLEDNSNSARLVSDIILLKMFNNSPFLGTGLGSFESLKDVYMPSIIGSPIMDTVGVPHNMYLGILSEAGIFVFLLYSYIMIKPIFIYKRLFNNFRHKNFSYIFLGLMGFLIIYNIDSLFHNYYTQNFIWIVIGFGYGMLANRKLIEVKNNEYIKNY